MNQNPTSHSAWEEKLSWFKSSSQHRTLNTLDGEPIEFEWNISQYSPHCSSATKSMSSCPKWAIHHNSKDDLSSCRCSMTPYGELKTMNGNAMWTPHFFAKRILTRTLVILRARIRKEVVSIMLTDHHKSRWIHDDQIRRKRTPSFPSHESIVPRNALKQRRWKNYQYTSVPMEIRLKLFFAPLFLLISLVSTEQSQLCVMNTGLVKQERGDCWQDNLTPLFEPASLLMKTPSLSTEVLAQKNLLQKCQERVDRISQQNRLNFVLRIPDNSWSRRVLYDERHWRVFTIYRTSGMSWVHFAKRWKIIWPERLDTREYQNWARVRSHNQLPAR